MKKLTALVVVGTSLIGMGLLWNALEAWALPTPDAVAITPAILDQLTVQDNPLSVQHLPVKLDLQARTSPAGGRLIQLYGQPAPTNTPARPLPVLLTNTPASPLPVQPTSTPAAPERNAQSVLSQDLSSPVAAGPPERTRSETLIEQPVRDDARTRQALQLAQAVPQAGMRFQVTDAGANVNRRVSPQSPQSPSQRCVEVLLNPQMDVVEFGDGTGTVDAWTIMAQKIYYSTVDPHSAAHSLVMRDELDGSDTVGIYIGSTYYDYDEFGQAFNTPRGLTSLRTVFYRKYFNPDSYDYVFARVWTLDSGGSLDEFIGAVQIDDASYPAETWQGFYWDLTSAQLVTASNKSLALVFTMFSDQVSPGERMYLDDAQVTLCYETGPSTVYLPLLIKTIDSGPVCAPYEPDGVSRRGSTTVGATCSGSFGQVDTEDYYSLNLNGATKVRLELFDLPTGTNWDAMIYEDATGYPLACHIGTVGDQNKSADCPTLSLSKNYFVMVSAGTAPGAGANTYQMSVLQ